MRTFLNGVMGTLVLVICIIGSLFISALTLIFGLLHWVPPLKSWRHSMMQFALTIPTLWVSFVNMTLWLRPGRIEISGPSDLSNQKWYLLISNHQTWLDILILGYAFNRKTPIIKFFMKKELLWSLPILGLTTWVLGYPFMERHSKSDIRKNPALRSQDIETTKKACGKFKEFPTSVMNFAEGTRFTQEKRERQKSPFNHLLKPKAGGVSIVMNELRDCLSGILNVTIHYSEPNMTLTKFFLFGCKKLSVVYELLPLSPDLIGDYYEDRKFRAYVQQWLNHLWQKKDLFLDEMDSLT